MEIQHPSHEHPLVLNDGDDKLECRGCGHPGEGPIYACKDCEFYLHKSCNELAPHIEEHPFHPPHLLRLDGEWRNACHCCYRFCYFSYKCDECSFMLDPQRASLHPILNLRDPKHLFFLLDKVDFYEGLQCDVCLVNFSGPCSNSPAFICAIPQCDYALHLECSPLPFPETIRHSEYHSYHDLVFVPTALEGGFSDEHFCDACEMPRDPKLPAYICKECPYTAHVYCALSEVFPSLVEKHENDLIERGTSLDAFLHYFEAEVLRLSEEKEKLETEREAKQQEIKAIEDELSQYEASNVSD